MKRFILPGFLTLCAVLPAMAADWPSNNYMQTSTTYNGAATSTHMGVSSGSTTADAYYTIAAGYYLPKSSYSALACPAGKYCVGATAIKRSTTTDQGGATASTAPGAVSKGYWASGGAKKAAPTSSSDCVGSSPSCGQCLSGFTTASTGSTSYTACRKTTTDGAQCSNIFPVTVGWPWSSIVYSSLDNPNFGQNYTLDSTYTHTTSNCTTSQTSASGSGACVADNPDNCFIRGITCASDDFTLWSGGIKGTSREQEWTSGSGSDTSVYSQNVSWNESVIRPKIGTFTVPFNNGVEVKGLWMNANTTSGYHYDTTASTCGCQIQTIKRSNGKTYPVVSTWATGVGSSGTCAERCIALFSTTADIFSKFDNIYPLECLPKSLTIVLDGNSATSGTIANQSATAGHAVAAKCTSGNVIGTNTIIWHKTANANNTNIVKTGNKVFVGWGESASATSPTTLTCVSENLSDSTLGTYKTYYAVWKDASCTAGTGAQSVSVNSVSDNKVVCNRKNKAGYYCSATQTGSNMQNAVTVTCDACPGNWTSAANSATANTACTRSIVLNKNGGSGKITVGSTDYSGTDNGSITCNYNTACTFPATTNLTKTGYAFNGKWSINSNCSDGGSATPTVTATGATVTYYACTTTNSITITWTGVSSIPSSGFTAISNNTTTSSVSYNGNIVTPSGAVAAAAGQTFLGWKFTSAQ